MPRQVCNQPKTLADICVEYAAVNIDDILKYEEQLELTPHHEIITKLQELPASIYELVSDKFLEIGKIHDGNYPKILNHQTRHLVLGRESCNITDQPKFLEYIRDKCRNVVKLDLTPLLSTECWFDIDVTTRSRLICGAFSEMAQLEWITFGSNCDGDDECLKVIASKCPKLKYLYLSCWHVNPAITQDGILYVARNCRQLTNVYLVDEPEEYQFNPEFNPECISELVLFCPELKILDYIFNAKSVAEAVETMEMYSTLCNEGRRRACSPYLNMDTVLLASQPRIFKLKELSVDCAEFVLTAHDFDQIGKHCPFLESLFVDRPRNLEPNALNGLFNLPLRSFEVSDPENDREPIRHDILMLLRAVGGTLTSLKLENQRQFDLRVLSGDCPNLTDLTLSFCDEISPTWSNYTSVLFKLLKQLSIEHSTMSDGLFITLLASPKLETLDLHLTDDEE